MYHNLPYPQVFEHETKNKEGQATANGTYCVSTGQFTGRSPKDKYFVKQVACLSYAVYGTCTISSVPYLQGGMAAPRLLSPVPIYIHMLHRRARRFLFFGASIPCFVGLNGVALLVSHEHNSVEQDF